MTKPLAVLEIQIVLDCPTKNADVVPWARNIVACVTGNPDFPSPSPGLATVTDLIDAYATAQQAMVRGGGGKRTARDDAKKDLKRALGHLADYVLEVAQTAENPVAVVEGAGMKVKKRSVRSKDPFSASDGPASGDVLLVVRVVAVIASYYWQFSLDGQSWTSAPETLQAETLIPGLDPGKVHYFRFRALTRKGYTEWSKPLPHRVR